MAGLPYISDTGSVSTKLLQQYPGYQDFNIANHHTVYVFDVVEKVAGKPYLTNKRPIFQSKDWIPHGQKVLREGYFLQALAALSKSLMLKASYFSAYGLIIWQ